MEPLPKSLLKYVLHICRPYRLQLLGLVVFAQFWAAQMSLGPYLMKLIVDRVVEAGEEADVLIQSVIFPAFLYFFMGALLTLGFRYTDWLQLNIFPRMRRDIIAEMFSFLKLHSYGDLQDHSSGAMSNKMDRMASGLTQGIARGINYFFARIIAFGIATLTLFFVHPFFALLLLVWTVIFTFATYSFSKRTHFDSKEFARSRSDVMGKIVDTISNSISMKLFTNETDEEKNFIDALDHAMKSDQRLHRNILRAKGFQSWVVILLLGAMLLLLVYEKVHHRVSVGDFALVLALTTALIEELFSIGQELVQFSQDMGMCEEALKAIVKEPTIQDAKNAKTLLVKEGKIEFDRVSFHYSAGNELFVAKSVTISPREKVGIVGLSGSGKSTFVNLIPRFFDIEGGSIKIDGQDIREVTQCSLRDQMTMIPQDPLLFNRSLLENIRYARKEASDREVKEAAERAYCHSFISQFKLGYHTVVGERGVKLSGGQRQQISLARAFLRDAPILILDEPTSSIDIGTEKKIHQSLLALMEGKTTLVVTHRLSTLASMDRILHFHDGVITEEMINPKMGSHDLTVKTWACHPPPENQLSGRV